MFEIKNNMYELKFNMKTIKQIESVTKENIVSVIQRSNGILSLTDLCTYVGFGLYNDIGARISPQQGLTLAEDWIEEAGFLAVNEEVLTSIDRDCPFLFKVG